MVEIDESGEWSAVPTRVLAWGNNGQGQTAVPVDAENVVGLAVDYGHTVALRANGTVIAWGDNMYGQTNVPNDLADVVKVAPGRTYSFGLRRDGSVMKWPLGPYGESSVPEGLGDVVALGAGGWNAVAVRRDGTVVAWGDSTFGQTNVPPGLADVVAVSVGQLHSLALKRDGTVVAWGYALKGRTAVPAGLNEVKAVAVGYGHSAVLKNDGTVVAWGDNTYQQTNVPIGLTDVIAIDAGTFHTVALKKDGTLVSWGNGGKPIANQPVPLGGVVEVAAGSLFTAVSVRSVAIPRTQVGDVSSRTLRITNPSATTAIRGLSASLVGSTQGQFRIDSALPSSLAPGESGEFVVSYTPDFDVDASGMLTIHAMGLTSPYEVMLHVRKASLSVVDGMRNEVPVNGEPGVVAWGDSLYGKTKVPTDLRDVVQVAAGSDFSVALSQDGTAIEWGENYGGRTLLPPALTNASQISAGAYFTLALRNDGSVVSGGLDYSGNTRVPRGLNQVVGIAAYGHAYALQSTGRLVGWGDNFFGQTATPENLSDIAQITVGENHTVALRKNGTVVAWGNNGGGEINVPANLTGVVSISTGRSHTVGLKNDGSFFSFGNDHLGATQPPANLGKLASVYAGEYYTNAIRKDGRVVSWGARTDVPVTLSGVLSLGLGGRHTVALTEAAGVFAETSILTTREHDLFIKNSGTAFLHGVRLAIEGPDADQFELSTSVVDEVGSKDAPFSLKFAPKRLGQAHAVLKVFSNDLAGPFILPLRGKGSFEIEATRAAVRNSPFTFAPMRFDLSPIVKLQTLRFVNPTEATLPGLRVILANLPSGVQVLSSSKGELVDTAEIIYSRRIAPREVVKFDLVYIDPGKRSLSLLRASSIWTQALEVEEPPPGPVAGSLVPLLSATLFRKLPLLQWSSLPNATYVVEYSDDRGSTWHSAVHRLSLGTSRCYWIDRGQPETYTKPKGAPNRPSGRFYRVKRL